MTHKRKPGKPTHRGTRKRGRGRGGKARPALPVQPAEPSAPPSDGSEPCAFCGADAKPGTCTHGGLIQHP